MLGPGEPDPPLPFHLPVPFDGGGYVTVDTVFSIGGDVPPLPPFPVPALPGPPGGRFPPVPGPL
jgi:hypothetical protein